MNSLAARAGRWSAAHWKTAVLGWLAFMVLAFVAGGAVGTRKLPDADSSSGESAVAQRILAKAGFEGHADESVVVTSTNATTADPGFRAVLTDVTDRLAATPDVRRVRSPLDAGSQGLVSRDGHSALVQFQIAGPEDAAVDKVAPIMAAVRDLGGGHRDYVIQQFGFASASHELSATLGEDFKRAERLSVPVTLLILLLAFGALVAASVPVLLAFSAVLGTLGLSALVSHLVPAPDATASVILLIGMAVGIDYSLFYLRREREERAAGRDSRTALHVAAATSGHAVLISGVTVMIAMAGMLLNGNKVFSSIGVGTMLMVFVAMIGSLTVLPAMLAKLGSRVEKGRIPFLGRLRTGGDGRVWGKVLRGVLARPRAAAVAATLVLIGLALPALTMHTQLPSFTDLPHDLPIVQAYARIQTAFPGSSVPAVVVVQAGDVTSARVTSAIDALHREAVATGQMFEPVQTRVNPSHTVAVVEVPLAGDGDNDESFAALQTLRRSIIPATVGQLGDARVAVTGETAGTRDFNDQIKARAPVVFAFVLGLAFLLLLVTFRSIVVPLKAILLNLLSVGASYGILVAIFQHGWGAALVGAKANGAIVSWLPMFLFVILFGLSMDYHVFILSRVKELVDRGVPTTQAVERSIKATAGTVTSAAMVMVAVFAIFASLRTVDMKQLGVGLAVAIFLDATLIRGVLLPSTMKLLGGWNWYLPRWLQWLPQRSYAAEPAAQPTAVSVPSQREYGDQSSVRA